MRSRLWIPLSYVVLALTAASCSGDPETLKREYVAEGDRYRAEGKRAEAIVAYRNAVAQDGMFGEAHLKLASAYEEAQDTRGALRESVRAADLLPESIEAQLQAARLLLAAGRFEDAKARANAILTIEPRNVDALILLGNATANLKDLDAAIELVEEAIEEDPNRTLSYANLGVLQIASGDRDAAKATFERAVEMQPDSAASHLALGNYYWASGQRADAERSLKKALELAPDATGTNQSLAAFYVTNGQAREAEPFLKKFADASKAFQPKLALADLYVAVGKVDEAVAVLEDLSRGAESQVPAAVRLAAIDFRRGRSPEAYARLDTVLIKQPSNEPALLARGRLLFAERKYPEALEVATSLVKANPKSLGGLYLRALSLEAVGSLAEAKQVLETLLAAAPRSVGVQAKLADVSVRTGDSKQALELASQVVKAQPDSIPAHFIHGKALLRSGDLRGAERELSGVLKAMPQSSEVHTWLGMLHEAKKDVPASRRAFQRALELQPENSLALAGLIGADIAEKKHDAARTRLEVRLASSPRDTGVLLLASRTYAALGDMAKAESHYQKLLEVDPDNLQAFGGLATIYISQRRLDEARKTFEEAARHQESPVVAKTMIGILSTLQGNSADARKAYREALDLNPRAAVAANNLAWDYAEKGENLNEALQLAQAAKAQLPDNPQVNDTLGWVYYKNNQFGQAVTVLSEAAKQSPSNAPIHYRLGLAYIKVGNIALARQTLQRVVKLDPQFAQKENVAQLLATLQG